MFSCEFREVFKKDYFVNYWRTAAFENHVDLNSFEQFTKFQSEDVNQKFRITFSEQLLPHRTGNDLCSENTKFYGDRVFCFPGGGFPDF